METVFSIEMPEHSVHVSAILEVPEKARAILVLAHGAGAGMRHPFMAQLAKALQREKIGTLRFQFPYMEKGSKRPDRPKIATAAVAAAVREASAHTGKLPLAAGGKSFGARMTTQAAAQGLLPQVEKIVCFGFPLHAPKKPSLIRAEHFDDLRIPVLCLQGTRDDLADPALMRKVIAKHPRRLKMQMVEGADHAFHVLKSSGRTDEDVLCEIAIAASRFLR